MKILISFLCIMCIVGNTISFAEDVQIESIKISVTDLKMEVGTTQKIKIILNPANAKTTSFEYISSDSTILTAGVGTIIANKVGKADITVKIPETEISDTVSIEVVEANTPNSTPTPSPTPTPNYGYSEIPVRSVEVYDENILVKKTIEIMATQTKQFSARVYPSNATNQMIRWRSYDENIATVDNSGIVKGISVGETKIYVIANDNGRSYTITIKIIPYVRYPDSISIAPKDTQTFETGTNFKMETVFSPVDTTERNIRWFISSNCASIDTNGNVTIFDKGKIIVTAYTQDYKKWAVYEFNSTYSDEHFVQIKEDFGIKSNKSIIIEFDVDVSSYNAIGNIFVAKNANAENENIDVKVYGTTIIVTPIDGWNEGENYIFIKSSLSDIYGNKLDRNIKYKFNVRRV